jgi:hypothetical protein
MDPDVLEAILYDLSLLVSRGIQTWLTNTHRALDAADMLTILPYE